MKYKRLIIISGCIFAFLAVCVVLCFTLFTTHSVEMSFHNQTTIFASKEEQSEIIKTAKINTSTPIFFLNKNEIKQKLELNNPYLKVINIETIFPNKLVLHCAEREEMFCIKANGDLYYVCDDELKILNITKSVSFTQGNALLLENVNVLNTGAQTGEILQLSSGEDVIKSIANVFAYSNKNISDIKGMFRSVMLKYERNVYTSKMEATLKFVTYDNFEIDVRNATTFLATKLNLLLSIVPQKVEYYQTHYLVIDINPEDISQQHIMLEEKE